MCVCVVYNEVDGMKEEERENVKCSHLAIWLKDKRTYGILRTVIVYLTLNLKSYRAKNLKGKIDITNFTMLKSFIDIVSLNMSSHLPENDSVFQINDHLSLIPPCNLSLEANERTSFHPNRVVCFGSFYRTMFISVQFHLLYI